jgi:PBP1b-binding outer membrane lipoprotein LpoB
MKTPKNKIQSAAVSIALLIAGCISISAQSESNREAAGDVARPRPQVQPTLSIP